MRGAFFSVYKMTNKRKIIRVVKSPPEGPPEVRVSK